MEPNSPLKNGNDLLDMIAQFTAQSKNEGERTSGEDASNAASPKADSATGVFMPAKDDTKSKVETSAQGTTAFTLDSGKSTATTTEENKKSPDTSTQTGFDMANHLKVEAAATADEAPADGHFTDEHGNTVEEPTVAPDDIEDMLGSEHFSEKNPGVSESMYKAYKYACKRNGEKRSQGSITLGIVKGVVYTLVVVLLSFFTVFGFGDVWPGIIPMANDVFAFVKSDSDINVEITEGMTTEEVAELLENSGVIDESKVFRFYIKYKYDENITIDTENITGSVMDLLGAFCKTMFFGGDDKQLEFIADTHTLSPSMNYDQIISTLTVTKYTRQEVSVTIPEGYRADQIIDLLVSEGIGTKEGFEYAINEYPYRHEFVKLLEEQGYPKGRIYRLEGYLYPDTYLFYSDASETEVINKFLNNFEQRVWSEYYSTYKDVCDKLGFTFDQMMTFASIVQAEGLTATDFENVAMVFHNRFNSESYKKLESCATIQYVMEIDRLNKLEQGIYEERHPVLTAEDLELETPYNTYKYEGLPPAAICNPGIDAIEAALYPDMSEDIKDKFNLERAYYFNSDLAGNLYYAQTPAQHERNKEKADEINEQILNGTYTEGNE